MSDKFQELHDAALEAMPEGAVHKSEECEFCIAAKEKKKPPTKKGSSMSDNPTYSEEQVAVLVKAAVETATADLKKEIADLSTSAQDAEVEAKIEAAKAELEETIKTLQADLDTKVLEAQKAKSDHDELVAYLTAEKEQADKEAAMAAVRETRAAEVAKVADFPDDYLAANKDRWAAMSEEDFKATLNDYQAVASKGETEVPGSTTLTAARETAARTRSTTTGGSALAELAAARAKGLDPRKI